MSTIILTSEQEQQAEALKAKLRLAIEAELDSISRLLVTRTNQNLFGKTEFEVRDLVHQIGVKAYQEHLREKKTATTAQAPNAPIVIK